MCSFPKKASASGGVRPPDPYRGSTPGPLWGTSVPRPLVLFCVPPNNPVRSTPLVCIHCTAVWIEINTSYRQRNRNNSVCIVWCLDDVMFVGVTLLQQSCCSVVHGLTPLLHGIVLLCNVARSVTCRQVTLPSNVLSTRSQLTPSPRRCCTHSNNTSHTSRHVNSATVRVFIYTSEHAAPALCPTPHRLAAACSESRLCTCQ